MRPLEASARQAGARNLRWWLGLGIVLLGSGLLFNHLLLLARLQLPAPLYQALVGGLVCALGTALGAVPVLLIRSMPARVADALLGFGAGVMLAATAFSLLLPALEAVEASGRSPLYAALLVSFGMALGALGLMLAGRVLDDAQHDLRDAPGPAIPARILLFVAAIVLHNIPEGMAVGVAAGGEVEGAGGLALGIALQDVPEGLAIALVLAGRACRGARRCWPARLPGWSSRCSRCSAPGWWAYRGCCCPGAWPWRRAPCSTWWCGKSFRNRSAVAMPGRPPWG